MAKSLRRSFGAVLLVLISLVPLQQARAEEPEVVFSSTWGEKSGDIGLINVPEHEKVGPLSFCIEDGNVYLLDTVNERILQIDPQGHKTVLAESIVPSAICPDGEGGVWVRVGNTIQQINAKGEFQTAKSISPSNGKPTIEGYGVELMKDPEGAVHFRALDQSNVSIDEGKSLSGSSEESETLHYFVKRLSGTDVRLLGETEDGKVLVSIPIQIDNGYPGAVLFKGFDSSGNLYVEMECVEKENIALEVHSYTPGGERLRALRLFNAYFSTVYKKTDITPDGSVYQMKTTPDGVEVLCYKGGGES
ncbi:MAG: hypothetical protein PWP23_2774 [Candidatus Sumerlaeota bacterium]|nr:hypothetical protein [Candidatus Sumerlaeota bacterium]